MADEKTERLWRTQAVRRRGRPRKVMETSQGTVDAGLLSSGEIHVDEEESAIAVDVAEAVKAVRDERRESPGVPVAAMDSGWTVERLEEAMRQGIRYLPGEVRNLVLEASATLGTPVWQLLLGYTMRCSEWGELFAPYRLPAWEQGGIPDAPRPCQTCGRTFVSRFANATYCCPKCFFGKVTEQGHAEDCPTRTALASM